MMAAAGEKTVSYVAWNMIKKVVSSALYEGGSLYGGAVASILVRNEAADAFYNRSRGEDGEENNLDGYGDPLVHPETFERRNYLPNDLDFFFKERDAVERFTNSLRGCEFMVTERDAPSYSCPYFRSRYAARTFECRYGPLISIKIDVATPRISFALETIIDDVVKRSGFIGEEKLREIVSVGVPTDKVCDKLTGCLIQDRNGIRVCDAYMQDHLVLHPMKFYRNVAEMKFSGMDRYIWHCPLDCKEEERGPMFLHLLRRLTSSKMVGKELLGAPMGMKTVRGGAARRHMGVSDYVVVHVTVEGVKRVFERSAFHDFMENEMDCNGEWFEKVMQ